MDARLSKQPYGRPEIRRSFHRNLMFALVVSVGVHFGLVGAYYGSSYFQGEEENAPTVRVKLMKYSELGPPPSIMNTEQLPVVGVSVAAAKPTVGIPVPVPDVEVNPEQTIATQQELSQVQTEIATEAARSGNVVVEQDIKIDEEEPELDAFVPVEKFPMPVKQISPSYPEIARRAGVEGTVWVKILVTREGKAKKAVIIKSDAEIFNEPSIEAALQWVFTPAVMNSGPVAVWVSVPFRFRLNTPAL